MMKKSVRAKFRVKIKSLAEEVIIIRKELSRNKYVYVSSLGPLDQDFDTYAAQSSLQSHLDLVVKRELRHTLVAYGYLRGLPYKAIENSCNVMPKASTIKRIIKSLTYDVVEILDIEAWLNRA